MKSNQHPDQQFVEAHFLNGRIIKIDRDATLVGGSWQGKDETTGLPRPWDPKTLAFFFEQASNIKDPIILDIGANTGTYCLLPILNKNIKVFAFEPNPEIYRILKKNIALNELEGNIQTFPIALSDRRGLTSLKIPSSGTDSGLACLGNPQRFHNWREVPVPMDTLDHLAKWKKIDHVHLIKIDTEGCELFILRGGKELIAKNLPSILLEVDERNTLQFGYHPNEIINFLKSLGYNYEKVSESDAFFSKKEAKKIKKRENNFVVSEKERKQNISVFDLQSSELINTARLSHLEFLDLPLSKKRVLEVGSGIGKLTHFFEERGCSVLSTEARMENINEHKKRFPHRHVEHADLNVPGSHDKFGKFDIVFCYGTLYHLHNPLLALTDISKICNEILVLETCVNPYDNGKINFIEENFVAKDQAVHGVGCRPARDWIFNILKKLYPYVYLPLVQPNHPEFPNNWPPNDKTINCRAIFIASKIQLSSEILVDYIPNEQISLKDFLEKQRKSRERKSTHQLIEDSTFQVSNSDFSPKPSHFANRLVPFSHWINVLASMEGRLYFRDQTAESLESLAALARWHAPTVIIELGTLSGMSTRAWKLATPKASIHAVDLSFKAFWKANEYFQIDTSRITFHEQNILTIDFKIFWSDHDRVLFFVDAHDQVDAPIMRHVLKNALPHLPKDSLVVVDDLWFSQERLTQNNAQTFFDDFILGQIDELQCFSGHYAQYHKGGSFMGFREVLPLMEFVNSRGIDLGFEPGGKHVWFSWDGERHKNQKPVQYERNKRQSGTIKYNPLALRVNEPLASRILPKVARLYEQGQIQESARILVDLINKEPSQSACFALAVCQARLGQLDDAYKLAQLAKQAGKECWRVNRLADDLEQRVGRPKVRMTGRKGVTIFALPKPFKGHEAVIQKNAIRSWARLNPKPEIILMGNELGTPEMAQEIGARHIPEIASSEFGTPLVDDLFKKAWDVASNDILAYVNADIILMDDFLLAINNVINRFSEFLIIGQRWDIPIWQEIDFSLSSWKEQLQRNIQENGFLHAETGIDYFVHLRGLWRGLPPFALGRTAWDNWLVKRAFKDNIPIIDGTGFITAIHQDHGYSHCEDGRAGIWNGTEAKRNRAMAGHLDDTSYTCAASWAFSPNGTLIPKQPSLSTFADSQAQSRKKEWAFKQAKRLEMIGHKQLANIYLEMISS